MKKIFWKITVILVIIMVANTFSGCITALWWDSSSGLATLCGLIITVPLDVIISPIEITVWAIKEYKEQKRFERGQRLDGIDTFSAINSLPGIDSLTQKISSLPEEKIVPFTETFNSFSEKENSAMLKAFNNLSQEEIASSIETLNSMSEERLIATLNSFHSIRREQ